MYDKLTFFRLIFSALSSQPRGNHLSLFSSSFLFTLFPFFSLDISLSLLVLLSRKTSRDWVARADMSDKTTEMEKNYPAGKQVKEERKKWQTENVQDTSIHARLQTHAWTHTVRAVYVRMHISYIELGG